MNTAVDKFPTAADINRLARALRRDRKELARRLGRETMAVEAERAEAMAEVADTKDSASKAQAAEVESAQTARTATHLAQIDAALARISEGRYGLCQSCGKAISTARLWVEPCAVRCLECQQAQEQTRGAERRPA